jgi:hypothetical protein
MSSYYVDFCNGELYERPYNKVLSSCASQVKSEAALTTVALQASGGDVSTAGIQALAAAAAAPNSDYGTVEDARTARVDEATDEGADAFALAMAFLIGVWCMWILCAGLLTMTGRGVIIAVRSGEQRIGGPGGALEPPWASFLNPLGLFLRTFIPFIWRVLSAFLRT